MGYNREFHSHLLKDTCVFVLKCIRFALDAFVADYDNSLLVSNSCVFVLTIVIQLYRISAALLTRYGSKFFLTFFNLSAAL